ncbi:redoxin domain-containing protein [Candidatus Poribacteria bacterium]|nr:redoxin domain-containing protein [Candidatus Poribacteria bacterium]
MKISGYIVISILVLAFAGTAFLTSCQESKKNDVKAEKQTAENNNTQSADKVAGNPSSEVSGEKYKNLVDGSYISFDDMKGHVILVDFWATWCPPCRAEIPSFIELYDQYKDQNVTIVGISVDRGGEPVVKKFIEQNKINYPVIMVTKELQTKYEKGIGKSIRSIPTTIIVDRQGNIDSVHVGARPKSVFENEIKKLL